MTFIARARRASSSTCSTASPRPPARHPTAAIPRAVTGSVRSRARRPPPNQTARRGPLLGSGKPDRVAHDRGAPALRVARTDTHVLLAQRPDELGLVAARGRAGPDDPLQRLTASPAPARSPRAVVAVAARVGHPLARPHPAAARFARAGLQPPQTKPLLQLAAPLSAPVAGRCARWPCCRPRPPASRPGARGQSRRPSGRGGSRPTGTAP